MTNKSVNRSNKLAKISGLTDYLLIPERTRSLLWVTDAARPSSNIISFNPLSGEAIYEEGIIPSDNIDDIQAEPYMDTASGRA